jgi:hypothetical protein
MLTEELHEHQELDPVRKPRRKKRLPKAEQRIVPIRCADKRGVERWSPERARDLANFPSPARILLIGPCGTGKSTTIKNIILHAIPRFKEIYLIHEDAGITREYMDIECTQEFNEVPPLEFWNFQGPHLKRAVICDDLQLTSNHSERIHNLSIMFRYASTHKGLTIYFAHQSWFDVTPLIRKMADVVIVWKVKARNEMEMINNRCGLPTGMLKELFKTVATKHRDSICIDLKENSPAPLRLNIWTKIDVPDSDDEAGK